MGRVIVLSKIVPRLSAVISRFEIKTPIEAPRIRIHKMYLAHP